MSETKTKNLCTVPAADLTDSQYFIAEDGGELKRIPKAQVVLKKLEKMLATDTENLAGGGEVTAQELLDALAEQVANKLLAKSQVVNNLLATVEGNPLDATQGKALKELIDTTNNNLSKCVKVNPAGLKSVEFSNSYPLGRYFDISVEQLGGESSAILKVDKDTLKVVTYENNTWTDRYTLATKSDLVPIQKGSAFLEDIGSLSSPSQLKHPGFYIFPTITSEVNADAGTETMTEYATGDFYGVLIGKDVSADNGCRFGTLIITSPRINGGIWGCTIWNYKFIHWYKIGKS